MNNIKSIVSVILFTTGLWISTSTSKVAAEKIPEPECLTAYGADEETACGYNCKKSGDGNRVACAEWPEGKCEAGFNSVSCGPPAPYDWQDRYENSSDYDRDEDYDRDRDCDCDCDK